MSSDRVLYTSARSWPTLSTASLQQCQACGVPEIKLTRVSKW